MSGLAAMVNILHDPASIALVWNDPNWKLMSWSQNNPSRPGRPTGVPVQKPRPGPKTRSPGVPAPGEILSPVAVPDVYSSPHGDRMACVSSPPPIQSATPWLPWGCPNQNG